MNKTEVVEFLEFISGAYGRFIINENTPIVWHVMLKNQSYEATMNVFKKHIASSRFEPALSDLIIFAPKVYVPDENILRLLREAEQCD